MERRVAIKQMALAAGAGLVLPAWASAWTKASVQPMMLFLSTEQDEVLSQLVDALIPASDSPGAKALGVHDFVQKMVADCYETPVQENLKNGLSILTKSAQETFGKPFATCEVSQRQELLRTMELAENATRKDFYALVKNLTIQGYTTSEYVMTTFLHYTMLPGHYYGCVPTPIANK